MVDLQSELKNLSQRKPSQLAYDASLAASNDVAPVHSMDTATFFSAYGKILDFNKSGEKEAEEETKETDKGQKEYASVVLS